MAGLVGDVRSRGWNGSRISRPAGPLMTPEADMQSDRPYSPLDKETWLRVAAEWMRLAQSVDERNGKRRE